jgi:long-chain fatty acid transport protein
LETIPVTFDEASWKALEAGSEFTLKWEDTFDVKFGMQYKLSDSFYVRAGFYTDNAPSPEETLNVMLPNIAYKVFTGGIGYRKGKLSLDFAVEYLNGEDRFVDPMNYLVGSGMPGTHGMSMIVPNVSFSIEL